MTLDWIGLYVYCLPLYFDNKQYYLEYDIQIWTAGKRIPYFPEYHPCTVFPDVVTVESERSVLVTTEISTLRAPDETFVDSVREILVLLSLLPVVGCRWHATSYMNARCRHSTSDLAEVYRRFHTRTDEAWRYHFHETISSAARKRSADYIAAHNGPVNTVRFCCGPFHALHIFRISFRISSQQFFFRYLCLQ